MNEVLIVHDKEGYILSMESGYPISREPRGIPFLWISIPKGKRIKITDGIGVDVSVTPHQVILEDVPPSETELLEERLQATEDALLQLVLEGGGI